MEEGPCMATLPLGLSNKLEGVDLTFCTQKTKIGI
jgi:hypothetical protein